MERSIIGYHRDEAGDWVAELDCGHGQHVRHKPPFFNRPWVTSESGRRDKLGMQLDCVRCDRLEWPDNMEAYKCTREFTETTIPDGLLRYHTIKSGTWALIHVVSGEIDYHIGAPVNKACHLDPDTKGIVMPEVPHFLLPRGAVRFYIEFYHQL